MKYTLTFIIEGNSVCFKFDKICDLLAFLEQAVDTVEGFEDGKTRIVIETPTKGSL